MRFSSRRFLPLLSAALLAGLSGIPQLTAAPDAPAAASRQVKQYTIDQFLATTDYDLASFSPDGRKILVSSNETGVFNAFALPVDGGKPVQLTDSKLNAIRTLGYFPADERFLYSSDQGGDEQTHLYVQAPDGTVRDLTPGEKLRAVFLEWAPDGRSFFFTTNERDPKGIDVYEMTVDGYERKLLFQNDKGYQPNAVSPDRRYVALLDEHHEFDKDIVLYDRESGKLTTLLESPSAEVVHDPVSFTPDGKGLYYTTDEGSEFARLMRYDLAARKSTEVLRTDWDVTDLEASRDGRYLAVNVNNDARTEVRLFDARSLQPLPFPSPAGADVSSANFSNDGKRVAFYIETGRSPGDLHVLDIGGSEPRRLTRSLTPQVAADDLVEGQVVRFKSYDGVEIPGLLYKPHQAGPDNKVPALVWVHGGPGGQSRIGYNGFIQYLLNRGYAIFSINNRGSGGYGKTFYRMDDRKHGDADLGDCIASKKMLIDTGWVDPNRIGIAGGSYGGYMVLAALAFKPKEFAVGVNLYGVSNWLRTLQSIPPWWESIRESLYKELGDPAKDEAYLRKISPLFHAENIERPMIVLQGEKDPRVLQRESDDIVAAARKRGTPVEYMILPNEGHGFRRKESQKKAYEAVVVFLDRYLKTAGAAAPAS